MTTQTLLQDDDPPPPFDWRGVLADQGRTLRWLSRVTGTPVNTIYSYTRGQRTPSAEWVAMVERVLMGKR